MQVRVKLFGMLRRAFKDYDHSCGLEIILEEKTRGKTIFITTHHMKVADDLCDRIAFMVDGSIVEIDSPKELKLKHGARRVKVEYFKENNIFSDEFDLNTFGNNEEFLKIIKTHKIRTIHSQESTLEDVFIKVTGRRLR